MNATSFFLPLFPVVIWSLTSCNLEKTNINPNQLSADKVSLNSILPTAVIYTANTYVGDGGYLPTVFLQQLNTTGDQNTSFSSYGLLASSINGYSSIWNNLYANNAKNIEALITQANALQSPHYAGIGKILKALNIGMATDWFGDVPYSQAVKGADNLAPTFDSQEYIYNDISRLLDEAIVDLNSASNQTPASDDPIFKGNRARWIATAWTLKARYALHLTKLDPKGAATKALAFVTNGAAIKSRADDFQLVYGSSPTQANPWWTQNNQRAGWIGLGKYAVDLLVGNDSLPFDPRTYSIAAPLTDKDKKVIIDPKTKRPQVLGSAPGTKTVASNLVGTGTFYGQQTSPGQIITFVEAKFIEAEAQLILGNVPAAQTALKDGINASFDKIISVPDSNTTSAKRAEYILKRATLSGDFQKDLKTLITQKYLALFLNAEIWTDWRRTGYPVLIPSPNGVSGINPSGLIPRRFPIPSTESTVNLQAPTNTAYQEPRLWWDK